MMKKRHVYMAAYLCCSMFGAAGAVHAQGSAGQAGEFLRWGVGPKALGLGRAFTSVADDASALYWNAAGLTSLSHTGGTMMFMHIPLRNGASVNYLAGAIPMRLFFLNRAPKSGFFSALQNLNLGLGVLWHSLGEFQFFNADGSAAAEQANSSIGASAVYLSASYPLNAIIKNLSAEGPLTWSNFYKGQFSVGVTTKWIHQDLFGIGGSATGFDLGFKYSHYSELFHVGFSLRDVTGSKIDYGATITSDRIPRYGVVGISVSPPFGRLRGLMLSFDYGIVKPGGRERDVMFGVELDMSTLNPAWPLKLRVGANSNQESLTIGVNFSPQTVLGGDWTPHGDVTYANQRSAFDGSGGRYAISMDKNPFTARYWYMNAMAQFGTSECGSEYSDGEGQEMLRYLKNAERAKNPGKRAYRYEAALRRADIEFQAAVATLKHTRGEAAQRDVQEIFRRISRLYSSRAARFLQLDAGKSVLDSEALFRSFSAHVQSLILAGEAQSAVALCESRGTTWGRQDDLTLNSAGQPQDDKRATLDYLQAYALYRDNRLAEAVAILEAKLTDSGLAAFLRGHIALLERDYATALASVERIPVNGEPVPAWLALPTTSDCTLGDEALFVKAVSLYKLSGDPLSMEYLAALAAIGRFYPRSDMAIFLLSGENILAALLHYHATRQQEKVDRLVNRMLQSYLDSFSEGELQVGTYTYNYR